MGDTAETQTTEQTETKSETKNETRIDTTETSGTGGTEQNETATDTGKKPTESEKSAEQSTVKGVAVKLSQEQISQLLRDGTLEMPNDQVSKAVQERISQLTARAKSAEKKLADIATAQAEAERKALEEQARYKELYENERTAREGEQSARKADTIRNTFLLAAARANVIDPEAAFLIAKSSPAFADVKVDDEGAVSGIDTALSALVTEKPYLVTPTEQPKKTSVGSPSNPVTNTTTTPKNLSEAGDELERRLRSGL